MKIKKILEISLQHREEVEKAVKYNAENNYEYILVDDNNLIKYDTLAYLLRIGYQMNIYADMVELRHKNYNFDNEKVIADEKEYVKNEYDLTDDEVETIFENYGLEYQDRAIVGYVFRDFDEMVEEEKFSLGYDKVPYFNDEEFGNDLLENGNYLQLNSGKIVSYCY